MGGFNIIARSFTAEFMAGVITHPSVIKGAKGWESIDIKPIVDNLDNYLLVNEWGGFIVIKRTAFTYECHTQFLPEGRGKGVREAVAEAFDYMFVNTDCEKIITKAYKDNPASIKLSREFFKEEGETKDYYYYSCSYTDWIRNDKNLSSGKIFHDIVEETTNHEDDEVHDYCVGFCLRMAKAGNVEKAQKLYNEWAVMSGYEPIVILRYKPLLAQIGLVRLEIGEEVRLCQ